MEHRVAFSPQFRTGRVAALLPRHEGNHARELPEDVNLAAAHEKAVERVRQKMVE
jgi:hypothetical protein